MIAMDMVADADYHAWLDATRKSIMAEVPGAQLVEKRTAPADSPLNTAICYDTVDYRILPTGSLLRTSSDRIAHAFCAFETVRGENHTRKGHRYVFTGVDKRVVQHSPDSASSTAIVNRLLRRTDIHHPGVPLRRVTGVKGTGLKPAIRFDGRRHTFLIRLGDRDALRCGMDRWHVSNLRLPRGEREWKPLSKIELAACPSAGDIRDPRVHELLCALTSSLHERFGASVTNDVEYQRAARLLGMTMGSTTAV